MVYGCPDPTANPLNARQRTALRGSFTAARGRDLRLPEAAPPDFGGGRGLTVPNQDVPFGCIAGGSDAIALADGTVMSFATGKTLQTAPRAADGEWAPVRVLRYGEDGSGERTASDSEAAEYWNNAREQSEKLVSGMTGQQISDIEEFERHFPKSKFVDESTAKTQNERNTK